LSPPCDHRYFWCDDGGATFLLCKKPVFSGPKIQNLSNNRNSPPMVMIWWRLEIRFLKYLYNKQTSFFSIPKILWESFNCIIYCCKLSIIQYIKKRHGIYSVFFLGWNYIFKQDLHQSSSFFLGGLFVVRNVVQQFFFDWLRFAHSESLFVCSSRSKDDWYYR